MEQRCELLIKQNFLSGNRVKSMTKVYGGQKKGLENSELISKTRGTVDLKTFRFSYAPVCKICQNTGLIFDSVLIRENTSQRNTYCGIRYVVSGNVTLLEKVGSPRTLLWENFQKQNKLRRWRLGTYTYKNAKIA